MKKILLFVFGFLAIVQLQAQNGVAFNTSGASPDASAIIDASSTSQGILIPRVDIADLSTAAPVTSPITSLMVYNSNSTTGPGFFYWDGSAWVGVGSGSSVQELNDLSDAKTVAGSDIYLGINSGAAAGAVSYDNLGLGPNTLQNATGGQSNLAIGSAAMQTGNVSGSNNIGLGVASMKNLTTGNGNIAIGINAGQNITVGSKNIIIGLGLLSTTAAANTLNIGDAVYGTNIYPSSADAHIGINNAAPDASASLDITSTTSGLLIPRMTATQKTAIGTPATGLMVYQTDNTPGFYHYDGTNWVANGSTTTIGINDLSDGASDGVNNVFLGANAGNNMATGTHNVAFGIDALKTSTNTVKAVAVGYKALEANTNGVRNTAIGFEALKANQGGNGNTAIGPLALAANVSSNNNVSVGEFSLNAYAGTNDGNNTVIGSQAGSNLTAGTKNVMLGYGAGGSQTSGDNNIAIGTGVNTASAAGSNQMNIGNIIYGTNVYNATGNIGIGNGNNAPDASAVLDVASTTAGLLIPRMTAAQKTAIGTPATGLMIYQTDNTPGFYHYDGTNWVANGSTATIAINDLSDAKTGNTSLFLGTIPSSLTGTAEQNTVLGHNAGGTLTDGKMNILIGKEAGSSINTGNDNILLTIGDAGISSGSGNILIGKYPTSIASGTTDNQMNIGNTIFATGLYAAGTKVGIGNGNNAPTHTLDVAGSVNIDDVLHLTPGSAPSSPVEGDIYMDATSHKLRCYDGTNWQDLW